MIEILLTSSVLILALALLRLAGNKVSARLRYALWGLVLVRLLLPAGLIQSPVSVMNAAPALENRIAAVGGGLPDAQPAASMPVAADPVGGGASIAPPST